MLADERLNFITPLIEHEAPDGPVEDSALIARTFQRLLFTQLDIRGEYMQAFSPSPDSRISLIQLLLRVEFLDGSYVHMAIGGEAEDLDVDGESLDLSLSTHEVDGTSYRGFKYEQEDGALRRRDLSYPEGISYHHDIMQLAEIKTEIDARRNSEWDADKSIAEDMVAKMIEARERNLESRAFAESLGLLSVAVAFDELEGVMLLLSESETITEPFEPSSN